MTGGIDMSMADVSRFSIGADCALRAPGRTALDLTNAEIRAFLRLDKDADIEGTVRLAGAVSHGTLALHGHLSRPEGEALISASGMTVEGNVYLDDLRTEGGAVAFTGARLGSLSRAASAAAQRRRVRAAPQPGRRQRPGPADRRLLPPPGSSH